MADRAPKGRRQLTLAIGPIPLDKDRSRSAERVPPYLPEGSELVIRPKYETTIVSKRAAQRDWWPVADPSVPAGWAIDPNPSDPKRDKPRSLGLHEMSVNEAANRLETELRRLPVVNEIPDRNDCRGGPRPCPLISCPSNLYTSRTRSGALQVVFPNREPWEMPEDESCLEDLVERGPQTVKTIARVLNMTEERVRQIFVELKAKMKATRFGREYARTLRGV